MRRTNRDTKRENQCVSGVWNEATAAFNIKWKVYVVCVAKQSTKKTNSTHRTEHIQSSALRPSRCWNKNEEEGKKKTNNERMKKKELHFFRFWILVASLFFFFFFRCCRFLFFRLLLIHSIRCEVSFFLSFFLSDHDICFVFSFSFSRGFGCIYSPSFLEHYFIWYKLV